MNFPAHIESKLREIARKRGYSEVEYIHLKEFVFNLATVVKETVEATTQKKAA